MPFQIDGRGGYDSFALTSRPTGVMLLTRRQPFYPSAAHDKFHAICTAFGGYTKFGIAPQKTHNRRTVLDPCCSEQPQKLLHGAYHGRCTEVQPCLDEFCFHFNRRMCANRLFSRLTRAVATFGSVQC